MIRPLTIPGLEAPGLFLKYLPYLLTVGFPFYLNGARSQGSLIQRYLNLVVLVNVQSMQYMYWLQFVGHFPMVYSTMTYHYPSAHTQQTESNKHHKNFKNIH